MPMLYSDTLLTYAIVPIALMALTIIVLYIISIRKRKYSCFIAGSTALTRERDAIRAVISEINNQRKRILISAYTFEDFPISVVKHGPQEKFYNKFLRESTDVAIFIISGEIGEKTINEFDIAYQAYCQSGKPKIYTFCCDVNKEPHEQSEKFRERLKEINQYWTPYKSLDELKLKFKNALISELDERTGKIVAPAPRPLIRRLLEILLLSLVLMVSWYCAKRCGSDRGHQPPKPQVDTTYIDTVSQIIEKLNVKDELMDYGRLTIEHPTSVKYKIFSESLSECKIDWNKVETVLDSGTVIYPKSTSHIYLHAEKEGEIYEYDIYFDFNGFVEYSIINNKNREVLQDMFYSLTESDKSSYVLNDGVTELLTRYTTELLFNNIKKKHYRISEIEFHGDSDILSNNYPKIKRIKCLKKD